MKNFPFKRPILFAYRVVAISALLSTFFFFFGGGFAGTVVAKIDVMRENWAFYDCPQLAKKDCLGKVEYEPSPASFLVGNYAVHSKPCGLDSGYWLVNYMQGYNETMVRAINQKVAATNARGVK